jgi:uncharacterized protein YabN with tetrapyrrole methylase and pyrophosphatase domain
MSAAIPAPRSFDDALALMRDLRARCEWDREQTHDSLRPYLLEEAMKSTTRSPTATMPC